MSTSTTTCGMIPIVTDVPSNFRELLIGCIENVEDDYHVPAPMGHERFADAILADEAFHFIKAHAAGVDILEEDTDTYNEIIWAMYDYVENEFAFRGLIE